MINIVQTALQYYQSGMTPLPALRAEKRPLQSWKQYQTTRPTQQQIESWFADADAVCLLTGKASGNLELIDFDFGAALFDAWCAKLPDDLLQRLVIETSQSGGKHVIYQCSSVIDGNQKLAQRAILSDSADAIILGSKSVIPRKTSDGAYRAIITLIETRGEGGLFLCSPTPG